VKLADVRTEYYQQTATASVLARQLAYAGIAAVWVFKVGAGSTLRVPAALLPAAVCFAIALLLFDGLQYAAAGHLWRRHYFKSEQGLTGLRRDDEDVPVPATINRWPTGLYYVKQTAVIIGYIALACGIGSQMIAGPGRQPAEAPPCQAPPALPRPVTP
jgi:hypothetical protein